MSTAESARRVALLARPGAARDCVRGALLEVGADIVAEDDPVSGDPHSVRGASPSLVMVVLDPGSEDALGRFDELLGDPSVEVMFEEADVAVAREGWEAARWRRHLAAKLHHRDSVLPPSADASAALVPAVDDALSARLEELLVADAPGDEPVAAGPLSGDAGGGEDFSVFDPVAAESGGFEGDLVLTTAGLELDASALDASSLPPVTGPDFSASDFDPLLAELDTEFPEAAVETPEWQGGLDDPFAAPVAPGPVAAPAQDAPAPSARIGFGELSLADDDRAAAPTTGPRAAVTRDLGELERRISSLQLVDEGTDAAAAAPAAESAVVLVLAGLGGPDAVRQFLGALPAGFPRPVLVRQRLDGARYDKLVAQMQRATSLPVVLAEPGRLIVAGTVHVVGDDVGLDGPQRFGAAGGLVDALPPGSAVVMLSGGDAGLVERVAALATQGAWLGAQAADGCYDPAAAEALAARGAVSAPPAELARQLAGRWSS